LNAHAPDNRPWRLLHAPVPPDWNLDWAALTAQFAWLRAMHGVPQDPIHHAEGDVLIHTRRVAEALTELIEWRQLPEDEREVLFASALLHDVAKPATTATEEDGRITARGHARKGERMTRALLWQGDPLPPASLNIRERLCKLVRHHGLPLWFLEQPDPERTAIEVSQTVRTDHLALLAEADVRGRICADQEEMLARIDLFRALCRELGCYGVPRAFANDHSRFLYFHNTRNGPDYAAYDDTEFTVVLMAGLPGAGKDTWIGKHLPGWPVISLDGIRRELQIGPEENQSAVVKLAQERARVLLRQQQPFVWNATNVTRLLRGPLIDIFAAHRARVRLVYLEAPRDVLLARNRARSHPVPPAVICRLLEKLEVPDPTEAHQVEWHVSS
jgi:predicted kinase